MWGKLIVAIFILLICIFLSTRLHSGTCPDIKTMQNFEADKYMGKWYEIQKYPMIWETGQKCVSATYTLNPNGSVTVFNAGIFKLIDYPVSITGLATANDSDPSKLTVFFSRFGGGKYWVIDTDYVSYSLVYSCTQLPFVPFRLEYSWILSRSRTLAPQKIKHLKDILSSVKSKTSAFEVTDQTNCVK